MTPTMDLLRDVLAKVLDLLENEGPFRYRLIGTAAGLLRGVPLVPGDVDLLVTERSHVDTFARALASHRCLTPPTWMESAGQYYAAFDVDGVEVEASTVEWPSDSPYLETIGSGPWTHFSEIAVGNERVPVVAIELRLATELRRGRNDRADVIVRWMRDHGCDLHLLNSAMDAQGIDTDRRHAVTAAIVG
ncbi:hypothetical protein A33M_2160 [Rhodovulum sp. PH10]|uniref:hypothetical protein n=1 Tax=Rhodovulum sp. PH10 TaxID=1187851 RepID=UPI00027C234A|nr:hypothetical protein [Rhodovulum sp. PH10]EJW12340.1 hypothetical protein A33M_2160 [Rhodovulum sp. PH10]